ncbi:MAG: 4Fe-4S binding protein [Rhizobacter sp.]|nr:4Fe-4S binding protein [Chlorobiales bacterium]
MTASHSTVPTVPLRLAGFGLFLVGFTIFVLTLTLGQFKLTPQIFEQAVSKPEHRQWLRPHIRDMFGVTYDTQVPFVADIDAAIVKVNTAAGNDWQKKINTDYEAKDYKLSLARASSAGLIAGNKLLFFLLSIVLAAAGGLLYSLPKLSEELPGIKNNGVFTEPATSGGWIGIAFALFLILFYVFLYKAPEYITNWIALADPASMVLNGHAADRWFFYGLLYTTIILVMGVRMLVKYRHSSYQTVRTLSVMFFQTAFAFLIPQIMSVLGQPSMDLKNMWPLDYSFFFSYRLDTLIGSGQSGGIGLFLLGWGIVLFAVGVPVLTYFFGKRWYCSWVCGCGGLAETLGDPYRQLSDKSLTAWRIERWLVHGVLVFAVVMTAITLTNYLSNGKLLGDYTWRVQEAYGFYIGFIFAGAIGTGFYPVMGSRVWCRFGCPLAAYLGLVQRFKSRFRITVNGGQCISCGNCSTYCEMGIDVRAYAQRGENIVRSSCVGCGICAAVCPRGVLALENGPEEGRIIFKSSDVKILS